ncbi:MAG: IS1 family transposase [Desulfobacula sp.]|nr:IS1 family transposase [Desulfobacula sp.]
MIIKTNIIMCCYCGSKKLVRNGFDANNGKQLYRCKSCGRYSRENPQHEKYSEDFIKLVIGCYMEGMSLRGIEKKFKVCRQTVSGWLKNKAKEKDLKDTLVEPDENEVIEVDEMWSFVFSTIFKVWIWVAVARYKMTAITHRFRSIAEHEW